MNLGFDRFIRDLRFLHVVLTKSDLVLTFAICALRLISTMRVKGGYTRKRKHKKILKQAKGFRGMRSRTVKGAKQGTLHALSHAYVGRKLKKRNFRSLWILRINAAVKKQSLSYSQFMHILKEQGVILDRKILSEIAYHEPETFDKIVEEVCK